MLHPPAGQIGNQHRHTAAGWCPSRCRWAAAGPGRASKRRRSPTSTPGTTGVEGDARAAGQERPDCGAWRRCPWAARPIWDVHSNEKPHRCGGCRRVRRAWPGFEIDDSEPQVHAWREPRGPRGPRSRAEVPVGGGRAWPGFEIDHSEPKARVWRSRGRAGSASAGKRVSSVDKAGSASVGTRGGH